MTPITDEKLSELETAHQGKIRVFQDPNEPPEWQVVLRKPNGKESQNFRLAANSESRKAFAALDIVKATAVWPEGPEFRVMLDEFGFLPEGITNTSEWKQWVGLEAAQTAKK